MERTPPLIVITGPTASGKSALALEVAKKYGGEIICADSRTVYKGLDIGTAKPTPQEQKAVRHHLLDVVEPNQAFSAAQFKRLAVKAIQDIAGRHKLPILVGGTGLYIDAVAFDYQFGAPPDVRYREQLHALSVESLQQRCIENNIPLPENSKNKRHLIRAIELGGLLRHPRRLRPNTLIVAITTEKEILRSRIAKRAQEMVAKNVTQEVRQMGNKYGWETEALTGNIYRIFRPVTTGELSEQEAVELFIQSDMQLAKRQLTWLKRNPFIIWGQPEQIKLTIEHFVQQNKLDQSMPPTPLSATIARAT